MELKKLTARHVLGVALLAIVVMMWVASSFLMRSIFGEDKTYDKPFLVTWINTGTFSLYLIPWAIRGLLKQRKLDKQGLGGGVRRQNVQNRSAPFSVVDAGIELTHGSDHAPLLQAAQDEEEQQENDDGGRIVPSGVVGEHSVRTFGSRDASLDGDLTPLTTMETAKLGCVFSMLWFAANYFGNISLSYTNVASFTIISSLSGFFTLAMGTALGVEIFTMAKLYALVVSICGVILVTAQDTSGTSTKTFFTDLIIGDILALVGAALYGCYTVFLKFKVRNEERVSMTLFFGFVGIFNLVVLWPAVILLNLTGLEPFELPSTNQIWIVVATNAMITFVSDYLWVLAMLMTSPLVVTVGISMSIPLALLGDHLLYAHAANVWFFLGAAMVFASFIAINLSYDSDQSRVAEETRRQHNDTTDTESIDDEVDED